jgi:hypothetical protein
LCDNLNWLCSELEVLLRTEIPVQDALLESLSEQFYWVEFGDRPVREEPTGLAYNMVARVNGLAIKIWADEHPPPHFHVAYQGQDASFSIEDCSRLPGVNGLERYEKAIYEWWAYNKHKLIEVWNASRPTHCPVGPISVPLPVRRRSLDELEIEMGELLAGVKDLSKRKKRRK